MSSQFFDPLQRYYQGHSDWSCVLNINSVDSANYNLIAIVREAINLAIPYVRSKSPACSLWFSNSLKFYIKKKNQHLADTKNQNLVTTIVFFLLSSAG
jgi:hypothetical protein